MSLGKWWWGSSRRQPGMCSLNFMSCRLPSVCAWRAAVALHSRGQDPATAVNSITAGAPSSTAPVFACPLLRPQACTHSSLLTQQSHHKVHTPMRSLLLGPPGQRYTVGACTAAAPKLRPVTYSPHRCSSWLSPANAEMRLGGDVQEGSTPRASPPPLIAPALGAKPGCQLIQEELRKCWL